MREPVVLVRPVDRVRLDEEEGEEQSARAGLFRRVLLLERLSLQPSAGGDSLAVDLFPYINPFRTKFFFRWTVCEKSRVCGVDHLAQGTGYLEVDLYR